MALSWPMAKQDPERRRWNYSDIHVSTQSIKHILNQMLTIFWYTKTYLKRYSYSVEDAQSAMFLQKWTQIFHPIRPCCLKGKRFNEPSSSQEFCQFLTSCCTAMPLHPSDALPSPPVLEGWGSRTPAQTCGISATWKALRTVLSTCKALRALLPFWCKRDAKNTGSIALHCSALLSCFVSLVHCNLVSQSNLRENHWKSHGSWLTTFS